MGPIRLRPHHCLDIITSYGHGAEFKPHPYGHALHSVARQILSEPGLQIELVVGADEICRPCRHLGSDGLCDDLVTQVQPPISKQEYNDDLDRRLLARLGLAAGAVMSVRRFLLLVAERTPGIEALCTHPGRSEKQRLEGLLRGLSKLGIKSDGVEVEVGSL